MPVPAAARPPRTSPAPLPTREVILDTAERLFAARGVDGVAVRDLAREMGITASSLYNHFPGKQALYAAVLERGLGPITELIADAWQRGVARREDVGSTMTGMVAHLAGHPHLAGLLQRALLEESDTVRGLLQPWLATLYSEGVSVVGDAAEDAGWSTAEVPHLALVLFGMVFGYFVNAVALQRLVGWREHPLSDRPLGLQRRVLEEAIYRLLGPRRGVRGLRPARRPRATRRTTAAGRGGPGTTRRRPA